MLGKRFKQTEAEDASHVEDLLGLLKDLPVKGPSPALRQRLSDLSSRRLQKRSAIISSSSVERYGRLHWLKPALVVTGLVVIAGTAAVITLLPPRKPLKTENAPKLDSPGVSAKDRAPAAPVAHPAAASLPKLDPVRGHVRARPASSIKPRRLVVRLPYSNNAVATGTDVTVRVAMSQSELLSLGFPVNATLQDRRVMAELTLGDDGLPRAISLPLPLEVMKEKK